MLIKHVALELIEQSRLDNGCDFVADQLLRLHM